MTLICTAEIARVEMASVNGECGALANLPEWMPLIWTGLLGIVGITCQGTTHREVP